MLFPLGRKISEFSLLPTADWQEVLRIADTLRPFTEQAMKMEVAPWIKDYVVTMEKIYTEVTLEIIDNEPAAEKTTRIDNYRELFEKHSVMQKDNSESTKVGSTWFPWLFKIMGRKPVSQTGHTSTTTTQQQYFPIPEHPLAMHGPESPCGHVCSSACLENRVKFTDENVQTELGQKLLLKGDPGMGKTSLCKKVAWDWARRLFTTFSITFLVFLKLVKPGDIIENVIIEQNPHMEGLKISPQKLHNILESFGNRCLLILDGVDEHTLGTNQDVLKIIKGQKCLNCNIVVTSRPHSTRQIEQYFPVIAKVEGFTHIKAEQFASKILTDEQKIAAVLDFNHTHFSKDVPIYKCPILLSFLCLLVREDDIDLSDTTMHMGEIYIRMVRCLYKKYTIRKGVSFERDQFIEAMTRIGKLALKTLISGNPLMKRSDVIEEVGPCAFDYGLLIGHEDFRLIRDETADISVTFPHRSVQEFLGAFYLVWMLDKGEKIDSLFVSEDRYSLFLTNPLFFQFCLWFLRCSKKYLNFEDSSRIHDILTSACLQYINTTELDTLDIAEKYPALDIESALQTNDELRLKFLQDILVNCDKINLIVESDTMVYMRKPYVSVGSSDILKWVLRSVGHMMKSLKLIKCGVTEIHVNHIPQKYVVVYSKIGSALVLNVILKHCNMSGFSVHLHLDLDNPLKSLDECISGNLKTLHIRFQHQWESNLRHTVKGGCLKGLAYLSLIGCRSAKDISFFLFKSHLPELEQLNLLNTSLEENDFKTLSLACNGEKKTIPRLKCLFLTLPNQSRSQTITEHLFALPWLSLENMLLHYDQEFYADMGEFLGAALNETSLPNLKCLGIQLDSATGIIHLGELSLQTIRRVKSFTLCNCLPHDELRVFLMHLSMLEFRSCSGISPYLTVLLHQDFLNLHTLVLSGCKLNSDDLKNLAQANSKSKLPQLTCLDLSNNKMTGSDLMHLFDNSCTWNQLLSLNIKRILLKSSDVTKFMTKVKTDNLLGSLQEFMIDSYQDC